MKNSIKKLTIGIAAFALSLGSCSRQTVSLQQVNKLADAQTLQNTPAPKPGSEQEILPKISIPLPAIEENRTLAPLNDSHAKSASFSKKMKHSLFIPVLAQKAERTIQNQTNSVLKPVFNRNISSYSGTSHTQGWIGFAIACLIVAIILFAFGFGFAAAILWEIGIVILVVALVFFILWLLASAAGV